MSITNGQTITSSDLLAMNAAAISSLQTLDGYQPSQFVLNLSFPNVISTTSSRNRTCYVVMPDDYLLVEVAIGSGDTNGSVSVSIDNGSMIEAISMTETQTLVGFDKFSRYYGTGSTATGKPLQVLLAGSTLTITVANTDATTTHSIFLTLVCEGRLRRL